MGLEDQRMSEKGCLGVCVVRAEGGLRRREGERARGRAFFSKGRWAINDGYAESGLRDIRN